MVAFPTVDVLINSLGGWLKHHRELSELRQMGRSDFGRITSDLQISANDLEELAWHGPHAADELSIMLKTLGIDEAALVRTQPLVMRDLERVCSFCAHKRQCNHDFAEGVAAEHYEEYCLNKPTLDTLPRCC